MGLEKRNTKRQPLRYTAWIALNAKDRYGCVVSDVSDSGARVDVQDSKVLPDHFVLLLTSSGAARRYCRVMWRKPAQVGVKFERSLAEAANAAAPQKTDASAEAAAEATAASAEAALVNAEPAKAD